MIKVSNTQRVRSANIDDSMIPMINVIFLLLIFFMLSGQFKMLIPAEVTPPTSQDKEPLELSEFIVAIDVEGRVFANAEPVSDLEIYLEQNGIDKEVPLLLAVEKNMPAKFLDPVLRVLEKLEFERVRLITEVSQ